MKIRFKEAFFLTIFLIASIYVLFIKTELYQSDSNVVIRDMSNKSAALNGLPFILPNNTSTQDAFIIQSYLQSFDELYKLDKKFHLKRHYSSDALDVVERLKPWSTKEDFLKLYLKRLIYVYDQTTGIVTLGFLHTDPKVVYEIVKQLIEDANEQLNRYNKIVAQKQLEFMKKQVEENRRALEESIRKLEEFQNRHTLLDPAQNASAQFALVTKLETTLIEKKAKLQELSQYMNEKNFEIIRLKSEIRNLKKTIDKIKKALANPQRKALNVYIFEYERLKQMAELNKELYKQSLLQLEQIKTQINQNSKILLKITQPYIPQGYRYPEKLKDLVTIALVIFLLYGIVSLIQSIIKEHID